MKVEEKETTDGKTSSNLLAVPSSKMKEMLMEFHNGASGGRLGVTKILERLKERFIGLDISKQWSTGIALDVAGPSPASNTGNRCVLVMMYYFSK